MSTHSIGGGPFLACEKLSKRFNGTTAVNDASLSLNPGQILALVGPSGCGKTTFLRLIAGFDQPEAGTVSLGGRLLTGKGTFVPPEKRRIGMVFQDYALFPHLNVAANIGFGLSRGIDRKARVSELLSLVGLTGLEKRMIDELSGGQQQRVALARALAAAPVLLLLDEPFSNLDPNMRAQVRAEVRQIITTLGITAIFVTHDQEEALSLGEEIAVMLAGRIVQQGKPDDVYLHPAHRAVAEFLGDANFLPGRSCEGGFECELGRVSAAAVAEGAIELMVRPENLGLSQGYGRPVEVMACDYYGHDCMVTVRLASGRLVKVRTHPRADISPGDRLQIEITGGVVVFPVAD